MHLLCYLFIAQENFAVFLFFTPKAIKLGSTETQENPVSSAADSQVPNSFTSENGRDWKSLLPGNQGGFRHTSAADVGDRQLQVFSEQTSLALSLPGVARLQLLFSPLTPPHPPALRRTGQVITRLFVWLFANLRKQLQQNLRSHQNAANHSVKTIQPHPYLQQDLYQ